MNGIELIKAERERQLTDLGHTPEHDGEYRHCQLLMAATTYVGVAGSQLLNNMPTNLLAGAAMDLWPWDDRSLHINDDPIRNLVKGGALIAAEIDRLQRQKLLQSESTKSK